MMTASPEPSDPEPPDAVARSEVGHDLEYDLAHPDGGTNGPGAPPPGGSAANVRVTTATDGYDGDYGYDLAHDVPRG